jgi:RHS repeat-associated protein
MLAEFVDPGEPRTTYYYRDLSQVLSRHEIQGSGKGLQYFHHYDGSGDVSAWTNQAGREVQEYTYAPYGRLMDNNGPDNASNRTDPHNNLTWSGKPWDKETELYHFGARDYDPTTGTWLTQDLYRGQLMEPPTRHRYQYALNNPATLMDLYGFASTDDYYISPEVLKDIKLQGPIMDQNLMSGTQPYGGGMTGLYTTSSSQLYQQSNSKLWLAGTQHSPLMKSIYGGSYGGYINSLGDFVPAKSGCCRYGAAWTADQLKSYKGIVTLHRIFDARFFGPPFVARGLFGLPLIGSAKLAMDLYPTFKDWQPKSKAEQVREQLDRELGPKGRIQIGDVYSMDTSGPGNIAFGYYMESLGYPDLIQHAAANLDQMVKPNPFGRREPSDDLIQTEIGRQLVSLTQHDPNKIDADKLVQAATLACTKYPGIDEGCR